MFLRGVNLNILDKIKFNLFIDGEGIRILIVDFIFVGFEVIEFEVGWGIEVCWEKVVFWGVVFVFIG